MTDALRLVVFADSLAFTNDTGPQLPDDKTLYPNVIAAEVERAMGRPVVLSVLARAGMDSREAWKMVTKDRHAQFEVLMGADAVVVSFGSLDHGPTGIPTVIEAVVPYLRPASMRRRARIALRWLHPRVIRFTGARITRTSTEDFARMYEGTLFQVRALTHGAPAVAMGPTSHSSSYYGGVHPQREARETLQLSLARKQKFAAVASWPLVQPHVSDLNPDGLHWPPHVHQAVGEALAAALIPQLRGEHPSPGMPGVDDRPR